MSDETTVYVNEYGGKQAVIPVRCDLFPQRALLHIGKVLAYGASKYDEWNWLKTTVDENVNHMLNHTLLWGLGDRTEDHPGHAACRALFALELYLIDKEQAEAQEKPTKMGFGR